MTDLEHHWVNIPLKSIFDFARQKHSDPMLEERRVFFVEWLKAHFKMDDLDLIEQSFSEELKSRRCYEENTLRMEYRWCMTEPLGKVQRLRDDKNYGGELF